MGKSVIGVIVPCDCGVPEECIRCGGREVCLGPTAPTPSDLLTDPRVAAVVRALHRSQPTSGDLHDEKAEALAPFKEVSRGK